MGENFRNRPFPRRGTLGKLFFVQFSDESREFLGSRLLHSQRLFVIGMGKDTLGVLLWSFWHNGSSCLGSLRRGRKFGTPEMKMTLKPEYPGSPSCAIIVCR